MSAARISTHPVRSRWARRAPLSRTASDSPPPIVGLALVGLGVILALDRLGVLDMGRLAGFWPVLLIAAGGAMIVRGLRGSHPGGRQDLHARHGRHVQRTGDPR